MNYNTFINTAKSEDSRNVFGTCEYVCNVPSKMVSFYKDSNPIDVEIDYPSIGAIRFYGYNELGELHHEYQMPSEEFIFATCNGDPLFMKDSKVYMTLHGVYRPELIADSFDSFINNYVSSKTNR